MGKKSRKKKAEVESTDNSSSDFETRFGALVPWGGDYRVSGAPCPASEYEDDEIIEEKEKEEDKEFTYSQGVRTGRLRSDRPNISAGPQPYIKPEDLN